MMKTTWAWIGTAVWMATAACTADTSSDTTSPEPSADTGVQTETTPPDPRFDATTWPDQVTSADRFVSVWSPSTYDGTSLLPVLVTMHGYTGNSTFQDAYWGTSAYVDAGNYILAVPDGTTNTVGAQFWNATDLCCNFFDSDVDDVGFLLGMLDELEAAFPVDTDRIYVSGHSNGGFMSYRLACDAADRITAIASLAGSGFDDPSQCTPSEPVSILQVHGTLDEVIPYADGWTPGANVMMDRWAAHNGCNPTPVDGGTLDLDTVLAKDETTVQRWEGCDDGSVVELWTIDQGSHGPAFGPAWIESLWGWLSAR